MDRIELTIKLTETQMLSQTSENINKGDKHRQNYLDKNFTETRMHSLPWK